MLMGLFLSLLSLSLSFSGRKCHTYLPVTPSCLVLVLFLPAPGDHVTCASLPKVFSHVCTSVLFLTGPWELLLT